MQSFKMFRRFLSIAAIVSIAACASMDAMPARTADGVLVDPAGKSLYTLDRDVAGSGKSACNGPCIVLWPAFAAPADAKPAGDWTVVIRDDGSRQWAYKGKPLYVFSRDVNPGDRTGDGFAKNVWHLARP